MTSRERAVAMYSMKPGGILLSEIVASYDDAKAEEREEIARLLEDMTAYTEGEFRTEAIAAIRARK